MEANGGMGVPTPIQQVMTQPVLTIIPADSCTIGVVEEQNGVTGETYRDLILLHPHTGQQFNVRFFNREKAQQVGRGLIRDTPKDERGEPLRTPLRDMARKLAEDAKEGSDDE